MSVRASTEYMDFTTNVSYCYTMWKFHGFSVIQILREINFGDSKTAVFAIFEALNFINLVTTKCQKVQKFIKIKIES